MALVVKEPDQKDYELPEDGSYLGVIADVIDLGEVAGAFGVKPKVQIKWLLDAYDSEGYQFHVSSFYTASLHEKANLRKALKSILGADVSGQFDLEELLGINNQLVIQQNTVGEKTYANIVAILKAPKGKRLEIPADFVRKSEKEGEQKKAAVAKKAQPQLNKNTQIAEQGNRTATGAVVARKRAPAPAVAPPVEETYEEQEQYDELAEPNLAPPPVQQAAPAPANRAGTIRQARTVTPAPAVAPQPARRAARTTAPAAPAVEEQEQGGTISDEDIPF